MAQTHEREAARRSGRSRPRLLAPALLGVLLIAGAAAVLLPSLARRSAGAASAKMVRLKVLPVSEWGFGRNSPVRVSVPRPFGVAGRFAPGRRGAASGWALYGGRPRGQPGPPHVRRRFHLIFPTSAPASSGPGPRVRTLFVQRGRLPVTGTIGAVTLRLVNGRPVMVSLPPSRTSAGPMPEYHPLRVHEGMSVSEGMLHRLTTEGEGLRLGPVAVVRFDPILAVPE